MNWKEYICMYTGTCRFYILILANACPMSFHNIYQSNFWKFQFKEYICTLNSNWVAFNLLPPQLVFFFFFLSVCKFLECSFHYNMQTYVYLVITLNVFIKIGVEKIVLHDAPPFSLTHTYNSAWWDSINIAFLSLK